MKVQTIRSSDGEEMVVLARSDFDRLRDLADDRLDAEAAKAILRRIEIGKEEVVPQAVVDRLVNNERPIKVWREYRGFTQEQLAEKAGISAAYLWQIENGLKPGSIATLGAIAKALRINTQHVGLFRD